MMFLRMSRVMTCRIVLDAVYGVREQFVPGRILVRCPDGCLLTCNAKAAWRSIRMRSRSRHTGCRSLYVPHYAWGAASDGGLAPGRGRALSRDCSAARTEAPRHPEV